MSVICIGDIYWFFKLILYIGRFSIWATCNPPLLLHACFIYFLFIWGSLFTYPRLAQNVLCIARWPRTHDLPASASWVLCLRWDATPPIHADSLFAFSRRGHGFTMLTRMPGSSRLHFCPNFIFCCCDKIPWHKSHLVERGFTLFMIPCYVCHRTEVTVAGVWHW